PVRAAHPDGAPRVAVGLRTQRRRSKSEMKRRLTTVSLVAITICLLAGCGEKQEIVSPAEGSQPFTLMLDWVPNADHVGIYQALSEGDFAQAGLNVRVQVPSDPATPLQLLA